jgi:hypothetical protein
MVMPISGRDVFVMARSVGDRSGKENRRSAYLSFRDAGKRGGFHMMVPTALGARVR